MTNLKKLWPDIEYFSDTSNYCTVPVGPAPFKKNVACSFYLMLTSRGNCMLHYENCMMDSELVESCMQAQASKAGARAATVGIPPTYLLVGTSGPNGADCITQRMSKPITN